MGVAFALLGCQVEPHPTGHRSLALVAGQLDTGHPAVVAIGQRRVGCRDALATICTGTLIAPRVVLSAAHCFADYPPFAEYEVMFGSSVTAPVVTHQYVADVAIHPEFEPTTGYADLALLLLDEPASTPPQPMSTTALDYDLTGNSVRVVGFGSTTAQGNDSGVKRTGESLVTEMTTTTVVTSPKPAMTCSGDSGGPVLVDTPAGELLVAVTSRGDPGCASYADNTRIDAFYAEFIGAFLAGVDNTPTPPPAATIHLEDVCVAPCESDSDCPESMTCRTDLGEPRCVSSPQFVGHLGAACQDDSECQSCVRLRADDGAGACRCFGPCEPTEPAPSPAAGCSANAPGSTPLGVLVVGLVLLLGYGGSRHSCRGFRQRAPSTAVAAAFRTITARGDSDTPRRGSW